MTFDEDFIKIAAMQQELQKLEYDLIIRTVNEQGGVIADERVKEHYNYEDENSIEFDSRVSIDISGRHGDIEIDIYSINTVDTEWGTQLKVTGFDEDGNEISDRLYPENYSGAIIFISNYFNETL